MIFASKPKIIVFASGKRSGGGSGFENLARSKDLDADIKKRAVIYYKQNGLKEIDLQTKARSFPVYITYDSTSTDLLKLFDMPTTIGAVDKAIEMFTKKGHIGKTQEQRLLEDRELRNFTLTLQHLIDNDAFCRDIAVIISE